MERNTILKEKLILKKSVRNILNQIILSLIILLIGLIIIKKDPNLKNNINKYIYEDNIQFMQVKNIIDDYFGEVEPLNKLFVTEEAVFNEKIAYSNISNYKDGIKLRVQENYLVPNIKDGIVVFIGEKEGYGQTIIIEQTDGTDVFYANMKEINVNLYDFVKQGSPLGEADNKELYLVFQKEGNIIDYKKYL